MEGVCDTWLVVEFPVECQALPTQRLCALILALDVGQGCCSEKRLGLHKCLASLACRQCALQEGAPLTEVTTNSPEFPQRSRKPQGDFPAVFVFAGACIPNLL